MNLLELFRADPGMGFMWAMLAGLAALVVRLMWVGLGPGPAAKPDPNAALKCPHGVNRLYKNCRPCNEADFAEPPTKDGTLQLGTPRPPNKYWQQATQAYELRAFGADDPSGPTIHRHHYDESLHRATPMRLQLSSDTPLQDQLRHLREWFDLLNKEGAQVEYEVRKDLRHDFTATERRNFLRTEMCIVINEVLDG